jgi:hypothetical protein
VIHLGTCNWFYDHEYHTKLIIRLARVDNPKACFNAGMHSVFMDDRTMLMSWLNMLERSAMVGHDFAALVLSLVLHRSNRSTGVDGR